MILVQHDLQVLAVLLKVDCFQLPRLIVRSHVVIEREVAQAVEGDACSVG